MSPKNPLCCIDSAGALEVRFRKLRITRPDSGILTLRQDSEWGSRVNLLMQWGTGRQRCLKIDLFSGDGVAKSQILGVQEIASVTGQAWEIFERTAG